MTAKDSNITTAFPVSRVLKKPEKQKQKSQTMTDLSRLGTVSSSVQRSELSRRRGPPPLCKVIGQERI